MFPLLILIYSKENLFYFSIFIFKWKSIFFAFNLIFFPKQLCCRGSSGFKGSAPRSQIFLPKFCQKWIPTYFLSKKWVVFKKMALFLGKEAGSIRHSLFSREIRNSRHFCIQWRRSNQPSPAFFSRNTQFSSFCAFKEADPAIGV